MKRSTTIALLAIGTGALVVYATSRERRCGPEVPPDQRTGCGSSSSSSSRSTSHHSWSGNSSQTHSTTRGGFGSIARAIGRMGS